MNASIGGFKCSKGLKIQTTSGLGTRISFQLRNMFHDAPGQCRLLDSEVEELDAEKDEILERYAQDQYLDEPFLFPSR